jgi:hypothetical protein
VGKRAVVDNKLMSLSRVEFEGGREKERELLPPHHNREFNENI